MTKIGNEGGPFFTALGTLANTSSAGFVIGRFDERKGGFPSMTVVHTIAKNEARFKG